MLGAARAADALRDTATARDYYRRVLDIVDPESCRPGVGEARRYLAGGD